MILLQSSVKLQKSTLNTGSVCGGPAAFTALSYFSFWTGTPPGVPGLLLLLLLLQLACPGKSCAELDSPAPRRAKLSQVVVSSPLSHTAPEDACRDPASKDERRALAPDFTPNEHHENSLVNCAYNCDHCVFPVRTSCLHLAHHVCFV